MCDNCNRRGLAALEAIANGEEVPEEPEQETVETIDICLPFPVIITVSESGAVGIITNQQGGNAIRSYLETIGRRPGDCGHDHH